jgi:hypothetical protein
MMMWEMMYKMKTKVILGLLVLGVMVVLVSTVFVSAVGVASGVSAKTPLEAYPGEERTVLLTLQNTDVEDDAIVEGTILEGGDIASLDGRRYTVPFGALVVARMNVRVPSSASVGQKFTVVYEFKHAGIEGDVEGTGASFSQGVTRSFNVNVIEKPEVFEEERTGAGANVMWWIIGIIVVIIIIWWIVKSKKNAVAVDQMSVKKK